MLLRILSRICRRLTGRPREREPSAKSAGESEGEERTETPPEARVEAELQAPGESAEGTVDNLTAIRGIGLARQDRLTERASQPMPSWQTQSQNKCETR